MGPVLLDTHVLLWALSNPSALKAKIREQIQNPRQVIFVSSASVWEIGIKQALGKLEAPSNLEDILSRSRFSPLPISWAHANAAGKLPPHHKDPFDRMLIAQAQTEGLTLLTHDRDLKAYGAFVHFV